MRKYLSTLFIGLSAMLFVGCGGGPAVQLGGEKVKVVEEGKGEYRLDLFSDKGKISKDGGIEAYDNALKYAIRLVALDTKNKGFNYFVITNPNVNNLAGFPLNNISDMSKYLSKSRRVKSFSYTDVSSYKRGHIIGSNWFRIKYRPVSDSLKNSIISVWSVEDTLKATM